MPTDFAYAAFFWPLLLCIGLLVAFAFVGKPAPSPSNAFLGLGPARLARAYLGALLATLVCTTISAIELGFDKLSLGHITRSELPQLLPGYALYFFVLTAPLVMLALTVIGLPALVVLRRFNAMTVAWTSVVAVLFSAAIGVLVMLKPYNPWCGAHMAACGAKSMLFSLLLALPVTLGFTLAAGMPLLRSAKMK
nr:hypothetical protein [uncultured Pseudoxanthomonas sp.]